MDQDLYNRHIITTVEHELTENINYDDVLMIFPKKKPENNISTFCYKIMLFPFFKYVISSCSSF